MQPLTDEIVLSGEIESSADIQQDTLASMYSVMIPLIVPSHVSPFQPDCKGLHDNTCTQPRCADLVRTTPVGHFARRLRIQLVLQHCDSAHTLGWTYL